MFWYLFHSSKASFKRQAGLEVTSLHFGPIHSLCMGAANILASPHICADSYKYEYYWSKMSKYRKSDCPEPFNIISQLIKTFPYMTCMEQSDQKLCY